MMWTRRDRAVAKMASIGVDELKSRSSEVLRRVREDGETIDVTDGDQVVARMVPAEPAHVDERPKQPEHPETRRDTTRAWMRDVAGFAHRVAEDWPKGVSAQEVIDDVRRERW